MRIYRGGALERQDSGHMRVIKRADYDAWVMRERRRRVVYLVTGMLALGVGVFVVVWELLEAIWR